MIESIAVLGFVVFSVVMIFVALLVVTARKADRERQRQLDTSPEAERLQALRRIHER